MEVKEGSEPAQREIEYNHLPYFPLENTDKFNEKGKKENTIAEKLDLVNWVNNEKLDIKNGIQIFEGFYYLLHSHIYDEAVFARCMRNKGEEQRIKKALSKMRNKI